VAKIPPEKEAMFAHSLLSERVFFLGGRKVCLMATSRQEQDTRFSLQTVGGRSLWIEFCGFRGEAGGLTFF